MKNHILCFDLSLSNTGIAVFDDSGVCVELLSIGTEKEKTHPLKLRKIEQTMLSLKKKYNHNLQILFHLQIMIILP